VALAKLVELLGAALGTKPAVTYGVEQPGDMKRTLADLTLSRKALGYAPKVSIEEGITRFVAWLKTQPT
jgi:UDP-glucuronate 4-epimerase